MPRRIAHSCDTFFGTFFGRSPSSADHLLRQISCFPLPWSWRLGLRAQVQSGRPLTTTSGLAEARTATFVRFDLRIDKTAIWNDWLLDFYIDISNAILGGEELAPENTLRYVIPTVGFRGLF